LGIYWPRSKSFEFDDDGVAAAGAKIYFFEAGTSTPKPSYTTADLNVPHAHPVVADGNGRWPAIFLDFGTYKETATTSGGTTLWTVDNIPNTAPTDPAEGVDADSIFQTGDMIFVGKNGTRAGFVRCNGRTIGNAASGATERANADTVALFTYVYDNYANGQAAVSGGRGASAAADYAANKTIAMPDYRAVGPTGFDDMGNSAASLYGTAPVISGSGILSGSLMGANTHTILTAHLPVTTPAGTINQVTGTITQSPITPAGTITQSPITPTGTVGLGTLSGAFDVLAASGNAGTGASLDRDRVTGGTYNTQAPVTIAGTPTFTGNPQTLTFAGASQTLTFVGSTPTFTGTSFGSGTAHNIMARSAPVTWLMKL
jgi:hypothetical protein